MFNLASQALIYGRHLDVAQRMLDFDFLAGRMAPSVAGIIDPTISSIQFVKIFFGEREIRLPLYPDFQAVAWDGQIDTLINLASFRSAADATLQALDIGHFKTIVIIAEGIPERDMRHIIAKNHTLQHPVRIIGPATAGALAGGVMRLGNNGGSLENIIASRLYQKGSIGFVSRSGGMSNEMYRVIAHHTDGLHTGIPLGGDRFVGSTFRDIVSEYAQNPEISMIVMLGEVGSRDELEVAQMIVSGSVAKPVVVHCIGSFAEKWGGEIQFGHAGARANAQEESATYKNTALREAGAYVADTFDEFGDLIERVFREKVGRTVNHASPEDDAIIKQKIEIIRRRRPTRFTSTITDERGSDLMYGDKKVDDYIGGALSGVIGKLWLKRDLPEYATVFIDTLLILLADHGPAVAGATNAIVTARAGKDILSSLVSGLMTIGPRFGGAIDGAARCFFEAVTRGESPEDFILRMKHSNTPIPGIGHRIKNKFNPDNRCRILTDIAREIPVSRYLDFARSVESLLLQKKPNLILNVDGHIAASLLDIFTALEMPHDEVQMYIDAGLFNAFFILARSIGLIGHALDQKRLAEPLYRTPWEDILYDI